MMTKNVPVTGLIGVVCGDVVGLPYEFRGTRTKDFNFQLKLNDFSDDTILSVAIAHWLMGERTRENLKQHLLDYGLRFREKNVWGRGFKAWFESGGAIDRKGVASNGAAMRVTAIGLACDTIDEVLRLAELSARVSHDSDEAARGAQAAAACVFLTRRGKSKDEVKRFVEESFNYDLSRKVDDIRKDYQFEILCDRCVPESIICWLQSNTYEETIRNCVSLGGDADTMAAIAGGIAASTPGVAVPMSLALPCFALLPEDFKNTVIQFQ
jgi:ADP-ribosylglycohydrolase